MKIIFQSDDYGITKAQALGCIEAIKNGVIRNTGMFTNMPWADEVAEWIKPYMNDIALGIDLNVSTGPAILDADQIPSLLQEDGKTFKTSRQNRALDTEENNFDHVIYEEVYAEFEAQIQKYIELFGKTPDYIHGHAYTSNTILRATTDLARKYDVLSVELISENEKMASCQMNWYEIPATLDNQIKSNLTKFIVEDKAGFLASNKEYGMLICHTGYVESCLFDLSSFNIYRCKDLEGVTSIETLQWIHDNNIELITYKEIKDWMKEYPVDYYPVIHL